MTQANTATAIRAGTIAFKKLAMAAEGALPQLRTERPLYACNSDFVGLSAAPAALLWWSRIIYFLCFLFP